MTENSPAPLAAPATLEARSWGAGSWLLTALLGVFLAWAMSVGINNSLCGHHGFRQTQNASAVVGFDEEGLSLTQAMPSLGPPWRITQELPLYQWTSFLIWKVLRGDVAVAGRLASIAWFLLALVLFWNLVQRLADARTAWIATILMVTSPLYLFWSRSFMMESTAVATALAFGLALNAFLQQGSLRNFLLSLLLGGMAVMVKPSSFLGVALLVGLADLALLPKETGRWRLLLRAGLLASLLGAVFFAWSAYARKSMAPLILSDWLAKPEYLKWFTGEPADRFNPAKWSQLAGHLFPNLLGPPVWILLFVAAALLARERSVLAIIALLAAAAPVLVFFNVFVVHDYYHYESAYLVFIAVAAVLAALTRDGERRFRLLGWLLLGLFMAGSLYGYARYYLPIQKWNPTEFRDFARSVRDRTQPGDYLVVYGYSYSPEFAFYAERRCFQDVNDRRPDSDIWRLALKEVPGDRIGAVVIFGPRRHDEDFVQSCRSAFHLAKVPALSFKDEIYKKYDADVYLPETAPQPGAAASPPAVPVEPLDAKRPAR